MISSCLVMHAKQENYKIATSCIHKHMHCSFQVHINYYLNYLYYNSHVI